MNAAADYSTAGDIIVMAIAGDERPLSVTIQRPGEPKVELPITMGQAHYFMLRLATEIARAGGDPLPPLREWAAGHRQKQGGAS